ncbi:MAG: TonB-dependent receptor [Bacteroidota bacterium]
MKKNEFSYQLISRFMRIGLLPLLLVSTFAGTLYANDTRGQEVLNRKVSLVAEQKEVKAILNELSKIADIKFVYSAQRIPCKQKVSLRARDENLGDVLDELLVPLDIFYHVSGEQIVLMRKDSNENNDLLSSLKETDRVVSADFAIAKIVSGKITNETGDPLAGVSVLVKGTSRGTTTNNNGVFSISADAGETLEFSIIGYKLSTLKIGEANNVTIQLAAEISGLNEIVVVGYGTQKRTLVTGAISSVNSKILNEVPSVSISQALQGRIAGLTVTNNGSPGTQPIVRIRGISSISFASDPLYVVDGFPTGDLATIDTRDIESVDVLKDASAAAIYGSRATNGVVMVTTKKGRRDSKMRVSLDSYYGTQKITKRLDLLDTEGFKKYAVAYRGSQVQRLLAPDVNQPVYTGASQTYGQTNTDWQDAYFKTGFMTQHNVGLSGGNGISRFYASGGYTNQQGTAPSVSYKRYNFRLNSDHVISKVFTFGENLYIAAGDQAYDNNETGSRSNLVNVIRMMPHIPVYDPTSIGGFRGVDATKDGGDPTNPVEDATLKNPGKRTTAKIFGTAYLEVSFTSWLKFRSTFGVDYANGLDYRFAPIFNDNGAIAGSNATQATITNNRSLSTILLSTQQLSFDKTFGDHHVNAIAVYEFQGQKTKNENGSGNQPSNDLKTLNNATNVSVQTLIGENNLNSYLGRISYDYKGKYLLSGAVRRDGLSVWAPGKKWATFPSGSIGWRIDQEEFMKRMTKISELKVRAGYGITGINGVLLGNTPWQVSVSSNSAYYPFNNSITGGPASSIQRLGNKELEWEKTKQFNVGLDLGLFNNAFTLSAEYYRRKTDNLILNVPLPPSFGFINSTVAQNVGAMRNNGFEVQLGYNDRVGEFKWNASANMSFVTNQVTRLAEGVTNIEAGLDADYGGYNITNTAVGQAIQSFYGWQTEGIFQNAAEVTGHAKQVAATSPGDIKFKDQNKDGVIDDKDRVFLGSFVPKMTYALNLGANYKNFDLSVFFQGVQGNKIYNATRVITEGMIRFFNAGTQVLNAWTPTNTNTNIPRAISSDPNQNARTSDRFLENGSYLRFKNVMLGYNLPDRSLQSLSKGIVKNLRIYVSAQNIATITKYKGFDPEVGNRTPGSSQLTNGIDFAVYPQPKAFQVGIQAGF